MTSKAARFITQLMAEIAERDARIAEQLREITQLRRELGIVQEVANSALKAQQPSACVIGGTGISSSMRGALAEAVQQPASGGAYSSDPLACSGCAGWVREVIQKTLRNYRMGTLSDGEGGGYPLIDAMSADGQTVAGGIEECEYLAEAIWCALHEAAAPSARKEG